MTCGIFNGGDTTIALAQSTDKLYDYNLAMMGASTSVYANRMGGFVESVQNYQNNLLAYRAALSTSSAERLLAKQKAQAASIGINEIAKERAGSTYDNIMRWLGE